MKFGSEIKNMGVTEPFMFKAKKTVILTTLAKFRVAPCVWRVGIKPVGNHYGIGQR